MPDVLLAQGGVDTSGGATTEPEASDYGIYTNHRFGLPDGQYRLLAQCRVLNSYTPELNSAGRAAMSWAKPTVVDTHARACSSAASGAVR